MEGSKGCWGMEGSTGVLGYGRELRGVGVWKGVKGCWGMEGSKGVLGYGRE